MVCAVSISFPYIYFVEIGDTTKSHRYDAEYFICRIEYQYQVQLMCICATIVINFNPLTTESEEIREK